VRAVVADHDDRVLMVRWTLDGPDGEYHVWGTPGGGIEPGESHEDALRRELLEEVGHVVGPDGCGPCVAAENLTATAWHTVAEVRALPRAAGARVAPSDAAAFLERLVTDGPPSEPLELGL
jgi:8-oxo-dGTP pyrophosphatase MutT (NUDIX family)